MKTERVHYCHALACRSQCPPEHLFCAAHWDMVPNWLRRQLFRHYRIGQCQDRRPSREWILAARKCRNLVALREGKITPEHADAVMAMLTRRAER